MRAGLGGREYNALTIMAAPKKRIVSSTHDYRIGFVGDQQFGVDEVDQYGNRRNVQLARVVGTFFDGNLSGQGLAYLKYRLSYVPVRGPAPPLAEVDLTAFCQSPIGCVGSPFVGKVLGIPLGGTASGNMIGTSFIKIFPKTFTVIQMIAQVNGPVAKTSNACVYYDENLDLTAFQVDISYCSSVALVPTRPKSEGG